MWVLIDNYDSFTYILHHYLLLTGNDCRVYKNNELTLPDLIALNPARIILSPGPETPIQAGITMDVIAHFHDKTPILGVCLGHQALGMFYGARLQRGRYPMHGKTSPITHTGHPLFKGIPSPFPAMRYHSLVIDQIEHTGLQSIAQTQDGVIMAIAHQHHPCLGVQFHPESVGTPDGAQMLKNWAEMEF